MRVFRTLLGYVGTVPDDDEPVKQAASIAKTEPQIAWPGTASPIGPAPARPPITSTAAPPSMADALKEKGNKR